jgi:cation transport regulator ChaC
MSDQWYFAYGSNLSREEKENRTGPIMEARRTRLHGYCIAFNKRGNDRTSKANIIQQEGATVWGVIYRCSLALSGPWTNRRELRPATILECRFVFQLRLAMKRMG